MSDEAKVRVYVNGHGVDAPVTGNAVDAVRAWDPAVAEEIAIGRRALADSRGLPLEPTTPVFNGLIMRVVSNRAGRGEAGA
ncbi:MAG: hypothetical protein ACT4P6_11480 [Gemmatimonadaceae bacterium]